MAKSTLTLKLTIAWWFRPYVYGVMWFAMLTGLRPDEEKLKRAIAKSVRFEKIDGPG